jgi:hypothetical protein
MGALQEDHRLAVTGGRVHETERRPVLVARAIAYFLENFCAIYLSQ